MRSLLCYLAKHHLSSHSSLQPALSTDSWCQAVPGCFTLCSPTVSLGHKAAMRMRTSTQLLTPEPLGFTHSQELKSAFVHKTPNTTHIFSCKPLPQRYYDDLFYKYFHLQSPSFQDLNAINLSGFHQSIPHLPLALGRWGMESQAVCPKHTACPTLTHGHVSHMPLCRVVHLRRKMLPSRKNLFEFSKPSTWMVVGQIQTF